jgi:hypothetical protein
MCLIAYQPAGSKAFPRDVLENGWDQNPDGAGYMFSTGGVLRIRKPFYKLKHLRRAYEADHKAYGAESAFVLHFRSATHGSGVVENIHPHALANSTVGLAHNGILPGFDPPKSWDMSDTAMFCRTTLYKRSAAELMSDETAIWLQSWIGDHNKLVLMDSAGGVRIINEKAGVWDGEYWYSNETYKAWRARYPACSAGTGKSIQRGLIFSRDSNYEEWLHERIDGTGAVAQTPDPWDDIEYDGPFLYDRLEDAEALEDAEDAMQEAALAQWLERRACEAADVAMARDGK